MYEVFLLVFLLFACRGAVLLLYDGLDDDDDELRSVACVKLLFFCVVWMLYGVVFYGIIS